MRRGQVVLFDTNIIIEAVRIGCWNALRGYFSMETVEKCREEARTGNQRRTGYVPIDNAALRENIALHVVSDLDLAKLGVISPAASTLDAGERHLWAHAYSRQDAWLAACCDHAAVRVAVILRWEERLVSLEGLVRAAGASAALGSLKEQFKTSTLSAWRTDALLARGLR